MPYQHGYHPHAGNYGGAYQGYGQAPPAQTYQRSETQYPAPQQAMVMVPPQPRHVVQQTPPFHSTSPHPYQPAQPQYFQQSPTQYQSGFQTQYHTSPPPQQHASLAQVLHQPQYQHAQFEPSQPPQRFYQPNLNHVHPHSPHFENQNLRQATPQQVRPQQRSTPQAAPRPQAPPQRSRAPTALPSGPPQTHQPSRAPHSRPINQPTPQQRTVAHVQISVRKPAAMPVESSMARSPKRRRSNDGNAIPICDGPPPQRRDAQQRTPQAPLISSSPLTELTSSQMPSTPQTGVDYQAVLLQLSDEYITAAYSMSPQLVSSDAAEEQLDQYQSLMATAMGCLESVLKNYRQQDPRKEARIRVRLASLLYEETDNSLEAEEVLSKGISLCERNKLVDLKYSMQHLLARIMFQSSPKAALKSIDKLVAETEALKLTHWTYAFRFLHVALSLRMGASDTAAVLRHLTIISSCAEDKRHKAVQIVASAMEAMVHVGSRSPEAVELAQRALAAARTHQLGQEMQQMPQMQALLDCLDLVCAMLHFNPDRAAAKLDQMHGTLDKMSKTGGWSTDGCFSLPLGPSSNSDIKADSAGIFRRTHDGEVALRLHWLSLSQLYGLGLVLSSSAAMCKNVENGKAEKYLREGMKMLAKVKADNMQSLSASSARATWQSSMNIAARLQCAFACCGRSDWASAEELLHDVHGNHTEAELAADSMTAALVTYLNAMCKHASGDIESALTLYVSPELAFDSSVKHTNALRDMQVLASINAIVILRGIDDEGHQSSANDTLIDIESYCLPHSNKAFVAAWHTLKATSEPNMPIIKTKQYLQSAVKAGQATFNQRLLCVIMNIMTHMYFGNIVGEQADKSARAGRSLALKTKDKLWLAVADGMYAKTLDLCGKHDEARQARHEAEEAMATIPEGIKQLLGEMER